MVVPVSAIFHWYRESKKFFGEELQKRIAEETRLPVYIAEDPLTTVVRGCGEVLNNLDLLTKVRVTGGLR